jgi:hypothetical protein
MESSVRVGWWPILHLVVALSAIAHGLIIVLIWVANLALAGDTAATESIVGAMLVLGWVEIGLGVLVIAGLAVGTWLHRPLWARGVALVIIGMVLHWGWWLIDRRIDVFGTSALVEGDPALVTRLEARLWTMLAIDAVSVLLLVLGGALLIWHRPRPVPDFDEDDEFAIEDAPADKL